MRYDTPSIWIALAPTILTSILGCFAGSIMAYEATPGNRMKLVAIGLVAGFLVGTYWASYLLRVFLPDRFTEYANETEAPQETVIVLHTAPNEYTRLRCGLNEEQWCELAKVVHTQQRFTVSTLQAAFGNQTGRELYSQTVEQLKTAKLLEQGGVGVVLTDLGKRAFEKMATPPPPTDIE